MPPQLYYNIISGLDLIKLINYKQIILRLLIKELTAGESIYNFLKQGLIIIIY